MASRRTEITAVTLIVLVGVAAFFMGFVTYEALTADLYEEST